MRPPLSWIDLALATLAIWRVSHMLVDEDGLFRLAARLRSGLAGTELGRTLDCIACTSLVIAAPAALALARRPAACLPLWLALAGAVLLLDRLTGDALMIQRLPEPLKDDRS